VLTDPTSCNIDEEVPRATKSPIVMIICQIDLFTVHLLLSSSEHPYKRGAESTPQVNEKEQFNKQMLDMKKQLNVIEATKWMFENNG
jgi:hypothetical protein